MQWIIINDEYLDYLRSVEKRIPMSDYGSDKLKPFFGVLFEKGNLCYVTQVSSYKERHKGMKQNIDFYKLYNPKNNCPLAVVNLNYMFPVPKTEFVYLKYGKISNYLNFKSDNQRNKYIALLKMELSLINELKLEEPAVEIYELKYKSPKDIISKRCLDFKTLEIAANNYDTSNAKEER